MCDTLLVIKMETIIFRAVSKFPPFGSFFIFVKRGLEISAFTVDVVVVLRI